MAGDRSTQRREQAEQTRRRIFETALALLSKKGYDRVTVDEICAKAGVSKGTFYHYFKSKDQAILEEFLKIDRYYQEVLPQLMELESMEERMALFCRLALRYMQAQGKNMLKVAYSSQISPGRRASPVASRQRALYAIVEGLVREAQERGEARRDLDAAVIAETVIRCIRGIVYDWCLQDGRFDLEEAGEAMVALLAEGLRAGPAVRRGGRP
jgi:AcrR family transcriptional regulator